MGKIKKILMILLMTILLPCNMVQTFAVSLENVIENNNGTDGNNEVVEDKSNYVSSEQFMDSLGDVSNMTEHNESVEVIKNAMTEVVYFIVQLMAYGIVLLMVVVIMLDLTYILIPFSRGFLNKQPVQGGISGGTMASAFATTNSNTPNIGTGSTEGSGQSARRWISDSAEKAVMASRNGQGGRGDLKIYAKEMTVMLVVTPILLVLAMTGSLTQLGFFIGDLIVGMIYSLINLV